MGIPVGVENDRSLPVLTLKTVCVQHCLLLPHKRITMSPLSFDNGERLSVVTPEHIVDESDSRLRRHPRHLILPVSGVGQMPTCLGQEEIDQELSCLRFGVVVIIRDLLRLPPCGRDFPTQCSEILLELRRPEDLFARIFRETLGFIELLAELLDLSERGLLHHSRVGKRLWIECKANGRLRLTPVNFANQWQNWNSAETAATESKRLGADRSWVALLPSRITSRTRLYT